jgi:hypothetical protein
LAPLPTYVFESRLQRKLGGSSGLKPVIHDGQPWRNVASKVAVMDFLLMVLRLYDALTTAHKKARH